VPEEHGAAVVNLGDDVVIMSADAPRTADLLRGRGLQVVTVPITEFERLEGCVTCLSVRLRRVVAGDSVVACRGRMRTRTGECQICLLAREPRNTWASALTHDEPRVSSSVGCRLMLAIESRQPLPPEMIDSTLRG
jgi:hypothetical protein